MTGVLRGGGGSRLQVAVSIVLSASSMPVCEVCLGERCCQPEATPGRLVGEELCPERRSTQGRS